MEKQKGSNSQIVKKSNVNLILRLVLTNNVISRIDIAKKTGLSKMTVTNIISELIETGILCEKQAAAEGSVGRPPITLDIADNSPCLCGIYINRDRIVMVVSTLKLQILEKLTASLEANENNNSLMMKIYSLYDSLSEKYGGKILGIGISCIGPVSVKAGMILSPPNFHQIKDLNIVKLLKKHTGKPVFLDNDMNTSALCERLFGIGKELENFIYLGITNGIGAGIISDGKLLTGAGGFAGEIGHVTVQPSGLPCYCGNSGCLESYASIPVIAGRLHENLLEKSFEEITLLHHSGEQFNTVMSEISDYLITALTGLCNILDPQAIILGHEGFFIPDSYLLYMEHEINSKILTKGYKSIRMIKSGFKNSTPVKGSLALLASKIFDGALSVN